MGKRKKKIKKLKARLSKAEARADAAEAALAAPKGPLVSPLAPDFPDLPAIDGVRFATGAAGVSYKDRTDIMLALCDPGTSMAGVFTTSATRSPAVLDGQQKLAAQNGEAAGWAILVNSGNANAFTGAGGVQSVAAIAQATAQATGLPAGRVLTSSTGVIGEPLPHDRIAAGIGDLAGRLNADAMAEAARAIMTTDTFPKAATRTVSLDGATITLAGIAKGSGMIAPDMATMLAYVFTDARIAPDLLQRMVADHVQTTFNAVTVDGDTSTSDTLLVAATGKAGAPIAEASPEAGAFAVCLHDILHDLALQIAMDGEGATKLIEVAVTGAADAADARKVAAAIANSPLVKTAIAGEDANWGRVVMAVGKAGARADRDRLSIRFGDFEVARDGARADDYSEEAVSAYMTRDGITLGVDLGLGESECVMWTCDLTYRYVEINADYRS